MNYMRFHGLKKSMAYIENYFHIAESTLQLFDFICVTNKKNGVRHLATRNVHLGLYKRVQYITHVPIYMNY